MEECKCPNCGAAINMARKICEYCGTTFREEQTGPAYKPEYKPEYKLVVARPGIKTLGVGVAFAPYQIRHMSEEELLKMARSQIAVKMADEIAKYIVLEEERQDPIKGWAIFTARLRILDPEFKF